jgi:chlorophyllide a reductase subunit Y
MAGKGRMADMKALFEGVGTGDTAGIWEGAPNLRPDFRAQHQKKLDRAAKAAKAEEMI